MTNNGTATFAAAKINNGATLAAASAQFFTITDASQTGLDLSSALTFSFWLKLSAEPASGDYYALINKDDGGGGSQRSWEFLYHNVAGTRQLRFWAFQALDATVRSRNEVSIDLGTAAFRYIALVWDGSLSGYANKIKIYVDGTLQTSAGGEDFGGGATTIVNGTAAFDVGRTLDGTKYLNGTLDEIGVWSRALSSTEITDLYNAGAGLAYPFTVASTARQNLTMMGVGS